MRAAARVAGFSLKHAPLPRSGRPRKESRALRQKVLGAVRIASLDCAQHVGHVTQLVADRSPDTGELARLTVDLERRLRNRYAHAPEQASPPAGFFIG